MRDITDRINGLLHEGARDAEFRAAAVASADAIRKFACDVHGWQRVRIYNSDAFAVQIDHCLTWPDGITSGPVTLVIYANASSGNNGSMTRTNKGEIYIALNMFAPIKALLKKSGWTPPDGIGGYEKGSSAHPENVLSAFDGPKRGILTAAWSDKLHVTLTHEIIHAFDACRLSSPKYMGTAATTVNDPTAYYASPLEFNAFYQSIFAAMEPQIAKAKTFRDAMLTFASKGAVRKSENAPSFTLAVLNDPKMKRHFVKRLYTDWTRLRDAKPKRKRKAT